MDEQTIMGLIMTAGKAKNTAFEAIKSAKQGHFELAESRLADAETTLAKGHQLQTTAMTTIELGREIIALYQKISENEH